LILIISEVPLPAINQFHIVSHPGPQSEMRDNLGPTKICGRLTDWLRVTKESYASSREFGGGVRAPFPTSGW